MCVCVCVCTVCTYVCVYVCVYVYTKSVLLLLFSLEGKLIHLL